MIEYCRFDKKVCTKIYKGIAFSQLAETREARPPLQSSSLGNQDSIHIFIGVRGYEIAQNDEVLKGKGQRMVMVCLVELPLIPVLDLII